MECGAKKCEQKKKNSEGVEFPPFFHALLLCNPKVHGERAGKGKGREEKGKTPASRGYEFAERPLI